MREENRDFKAVTRLLELTQEGLLKWESRGPCDDILEGRDIVVDIVYVAAKDKRLLRLYQFRYKSWLDDVNWHWEEDIALELSDEKRVTWWRFPENRVLQDLLEAVKFRTVGVDQFLDELLGQ